MKRAVAIEGLVMEFETREVKSQQWIKCPFKWGLEDNVTIFNEQGGRLILVNVVQWRKGTIRGTIRGIKYEPVKYSEMPELEPADP